jgi:hypothetical protein
MTWCQDINLFATAARMAGSNLTRARFVNAMAHITNFPGGVIPNLRFGPGRYAGPHLQRVVSPHVNSDKACPPKKDGTAQGTCWLVKSAYTEQRLA